MAQLMRAPGQLIVYRDNPIPVILLLERAGDYWWFPMLCKSLSALPSPNHFDLCVY
jgi:hypothetical protein